MKFYLKLLYLLTISVCTIPAFAEIECPQQMMVDCPTNNQYCNVTSVLPSPWTVQSAGYMTTPSDHEVKAQLPLVAAGYYTYSTNAYCDYNATIDGVTIEGYITTTNHIAPGMGGWQYSSTYVYCACDDQGFDATPCSKPISAQTCTWVQEFSRNGGVATR